MNACLKEKIATAPDAPGVYLLRDAAGQIFYIGKAKSLQNRLRSYASGSDTRPFVRLLDGLLADVELVLTHTDKEAILLENELIKAHQPRFNVKLTDDKGFLSLRLDVRRPYPRLEVVRRPKQDGARYFGPYHSATAIRGTLRLINRHFQLRTCTDQVMANRQRPCLQYQIKRCPAPCVFDLSDGAYQQNIADVSAFLEGREAALMDGLQARMQQLAATEAYEAAALLRDQMVAVQRSLERQRMVSHDGIDRDILGIYREGPAVMLHLLRARGGRLMDARRYAFADNEVPTAELLGDFVSRYYGQPGAAVPNEILLPEAVEWEEPLGAWLSERSGHRVALLVPQRGDKRALVQLANKNAAQAFLDQRRQAGAARTAMERLQRALRLRLLPQRLECVDISHLQGSYIVASVVCFMDGTPHKAGYRHYRVRSTVQQDDFQSIYEIVSRRVRRGRDDGDLPQLLVIDGGKGQLGAAAAALRDQQVEGIELISLAKSRLQTVAAGGPEADAAGPGSLTPVAPEIGANRSFERVFVFGQKEPVILRQNSAELFLLTRARDEAHRFAITYHRKLRQRAATTTALDGIAGVGPQRRRRLLRHFGSLGAVRRADPAALAEVVGASLAAHIYAALHPTSEAIDKP